MSRFLVTGGAGFIGGHITEFLVGQGHDVTVLDNLYTGNLNNLNTVIEKINFIEGDICDNSAVDKSMQDVDHVIHHAAEISMAKSVEDPWFANNVNVGGTINLLMSAKKHNVKRFVLASSSAIYGDTGKQAQTEDFLPNPLSPYGASKLAGEHYCSVFSQIYGLETVCLRYFNVFGPRQKPNSQYAAVIPKFIDRILKNQEIHIFGDGEQTRDFVYVENIARANYLACTVDGVGGKIFNIASEHTVTVNELTELIIKMAGKSVDVIHDAPQKGDIKYSASDITNARENLSFKPVVSFYEGLQRTYDYFSNPASRCCQ